MKFFLVHAELLTVIYCSKPPWLPMIMKAGCLTLHRLSGLAAHGSNLTCAGKQLLTHM